MCHLGGVDVSFPHLDTFHGRTAIISTLGPSSTVSHSLSLSRSPSKAKEEETIDGWIPGAPSFSFREKMKDAPEGFQGELTCH